LAATERAGYALYESRDGIPLARIGLSVPRKPDQPTDYPNAILMAGKYMLHCHMMNHEELGMMQVVEVYADN
jgi:hypothetical protein